MEAVYIVLIIVIGTIIVVFMLRDRITRFFARYSDGEVGMDAAPPRRPDPRTVCRHLLTLAVISLGARVERFG